VALAYAEAVNEELHDLVAAGADVVQLDEPWLQARPEQAREYAVAAIDRALQGIEAETELHICHGYAAVVREKAHRYAFLAELDASSVSRVSIEAAQPRLDLAVLRALPSKQIAVGVLDLNEPDVEAIEVIVDRIHEALEHVDPDRLVLAPDCGMKYLPRETAYGKLCAMARAAAQVRAEL
jgi:5-methyltetrahydropteroyltriglutamate--homocysteine methyltransferase